MITKDLNFGGLTGIKLIPKVDERGTLTRIFDYEFFSKSFKITQATTVQNPESHTLRGLHFQSHPYLESKIVLCVEGLVQDVVVDLRPKSPQYLKWYSMVLGPSEPLDGFLVPKGFAHGYLTLENNTQLIYFMDELFNVEKSSGIRWDDPKLNIEWKGNPRLISPRDSNWALI